MYYPISILPSRTFSFIFDIKFQSNIYFDTTSKSPYFEIYNSYLTFITPI